jgi:hypothetical protein
MYKPIEITIYQKKMATHPWARTARPSAQTKAKDQANSFSLQPAENPIPNG